jgi:hypothetical protein
VCAANRRSAVAAYEETDYWRGGGKTNFHNFYLEGRRERERRRKAKKEEFSSFIYVLDNSQIRPITAKHINNSLV